MPIFSFLLLHERLSRIKLREQLFKPNQLPSQEFNNTDLEKNEGQKYYIDYIICIIIASTKPNVCNQLFFTLHCF